MCHVSSFPLAPSFPRHATCFLPYPLFWDSLQILYRFSPWRSKHKLDTSNNKPIEHQRGAIITNCVITAHLHNRCINNCSEWASRGAQSQRRPQSGTAPGPHRDRNGTALELHALTRLWQLADSNRFSSAAPVSRLGKEPEETKMATHFISHLLAKCQDEDWTRNKTPTGWQTQTHPSPQTTPTNPFHSTLT